MKKPLLLILMVFFILPLSQAQDEKFKALFMYNFTKYLEWPASKQSGDFIIGVYGNSPIISELNIIAQKRKVGAQPIVVKRVTEIDQFMDCNIVYVPTNKSAKVSEITEQCAKKGVVLITDKPGLAQTHSGINYIKIDGKQNFEINKRLLENQGIKVNSVLLSLGVVIE